MRADIVPGGTFPDYELTDHTKARRRLSELQGNDPMILLLSRGHIGDGQRDDLELHVDRADVLVLNRGCAADVRASHVGPQSIAGAQIYAFIGPLARLSSVAPTVGTGQDL